MTWGIRVGVLGAVERSVREHVSDVISSFHRVEEGGGKSKLRGVPVPFFMFYIVLKSAGVRPCPLQFLALSCPCPHKCAALFVSVEVSHGLAVWMRYH